MKPRTIILAFILLVTAIAFYANINVQNKEDDMLRCTSNELSPYSKMVFINGKRINDETSVAVYHDRIYFSVTMLSNHISSYFSSQYENRIYIRRKKIEPQALLQSERDVYIEFDALMKYVHINNDVYRSRGSIYIDSMLPASVNINGVTYDITNEKMHSSTVDDNAPDIVRNDGRGVWRVGNNIYIEDDWGEAYKYVPSPNRIS